MPLLSLLDSPWSSISSPSSLCSIATTRSARLCGFLPSTSSLSLPSSPCPLVRLAVSHKRCELVLTPVYKGSPELKLDELPGTTIALAIVLTALVVSILAILFWLPYVYAKVVKKDYTIRWYHFFHGPYLWKRPAPPPPTQEQLGQHVPDYRVHGREQAETHAPSTVQSEDIESKQDPNLEPEFTPSTTTQPHPAPLAELEKDEHPIEGLWCTPKNLWIIFRYKIPKVLLYSTNADIHKLQVGEGKSAARIQAMHERAHQYENETEHLYSFLQVLTACTNSFAHGANDVSNAVGPFAAIYHIWSHGSFGKDTPTPTWVLAYGGALIVIGLATYGYKIMAALGNRLTLHSPSRGFSMELGSAITVLLASQYAIPVSTTMCICGATAGVGVVSSGWRNVNWRGFGWIVLGWILTVPIAAILGGCLMGIILNAPRF